MSSPNVTETGLKRIPIAHPAVMVASWGVLAAMLYWGYRSGLQEPAPWVGSSVAVLIVIFGALAHRRAARTPPPDRATPPVLDIDRS